jgi:hypothetical protein
MLKLYIAVIGTIVLAPRIASGLAYLDNARLVCSYADSASECVTLLSMDNDTVNDIILQKQQLAYLRSQPQ